MAANWSELKNSIANIIKTNGNQEITGQLLQNTLNSIVSSVGENATFAGVAIPATNPGAPDGPVFYLATGPGVFSNFDGITLGVSESAIFLWGEDEDGVLSWSKKPLSFATAEALKYISCAGVYNLHGYISAESGAFVSNENYRATDYIPLLKTYGDILVTGAEAGPSSLIVAFYDSSKNFISGVGNTTSAYVPTSDIPENAKFVRCGTSFDTAETAIIYLDNVIALAQSIAENSQRIAALEREIVKTKSKYLALKYQGFYTADGTFKSSNVAKNTGLISIAGYSKLAYQLIATLKTVAAVTFWDKNDTCISELSISGGADTLISGFIDLTASKYSDVMYIVLSYQGSDPSQYGGILFNAENILSRERLL